MGQRMNVATSIFGRVLISVLLCASTVNSRFKYTHRKDAEHAEGAQRISDRHHQFRRPQGREYDEFARHDALVALVAKDRCHEEVRAGCEKSSSRRCFRGSQAILAARAWRDRDSLEAVLWIVLG